MNRSAAGCVLFLGLLQASLQAAQREPPNPIAKGELPQYVFFNKAPSRPGANEWRQWEPGSFTEESCREIPLKIGHAGGDRIRVGVSFIFSILENDLQTLVASLQRLLDAAEKTDVPVLITLDGQNWWEGRPDLWNWWDPALPGFDPANKSNVEWTGWSPDSAVKVGWRNWAKQHRVRPAQNIASTRVLAEYYKAYDALVPIIVRWYRRLPKDRKYLFGGVKVGWEASINVNAYYHKDGNAIFDLSPKDASNDPTEHDPKLGWTFGHPALGHAAVTAAGIKKSGRLTKEDIEEVVRRYLDALARQVNRRGIPTHLIFTHQGGTFEPWDQHMSFKPAMNAYSIPGWSFYSQDPPESGPLAGELEATGRTQWAASEWWLGSDSVEGWTRRFKRSLEFKACRFVCVYNWDAFAKETKGLEALRALLSEAKGAGPDGR